MKLANIELDTSIQCRAAIDMGTVNEYAAHMTEGEKFPPVILFGTADRAWIGDGWHRVMAARSIELREIEAEIRPGGRVDALKYALGANDANGLHRSNEDKRRCVAIALTEFPKLSDSAIGQLCGVDHKTVAAIRPPTLGNSQPEKRTGADGKQYPATKKNRKAKAKAEAADEFQMSPEERHEVQAAFKNVTHVPRGAEGPDLDGGVREDGGDHEEVREPATPGQEPKRPIPTDAMKIATFAICHLERILFHDPKRIEALTRVAGWCNRQIAKGVR